MWRGKWLLVMGVIIALSQGCAPHDKPLVLNEAKTITSIKVARYESACILEKTAGSQAAAFTGVMFGAIGGAIGGAISYSMESSNGKALAVRCGLSDFDQLVLEGFVQRLESDFPDWPKPVVEQYPIKDETSLDHSACNFVLKAGIQVDSSGLTTATFAKMIDPKQQVIWEKSFTYKSADFARSHSLKELEADNGKLLKEEMAFAAEKTASNLIGHLKGGPRAGESGKE